MTFDLPARPDDGAVISIAALPDCIERLVEPAGNDAGRVTINADHASERGDELGQSAAQDRAGLLFGPKTLVETGTPLPPPFQEHRHEWFEVRLRHLYPHGA